MTAAAYVAYAALCVALASPAIWAAGHRAGQASGRREAERHKATALGWMKAAIAAERRADEAEALLSIDFDVRGTL